MFDYGAEIAYPIHESITMGIVNSCSQVRKRERQREKARERENSILLCCFSLVHNLGNGGRDIVAPGRAH